jgi:hypothetical protein
MFFLSGIGTKFINVAKENDQRSKGVQSKGVGNIEHAAVWWAYIDTNRLASNAEAS